MMLVEVNIRNPLQADKDSAGDLDNYLEGTAKGRPYLFRNTI